MKKNIFASLTITLLFSQVAFADDERVVIEDLNQQLTQELTKDDLLATTQDYMLEEAVRPQARRSALFAHILDTMAKSATLAKADNVSQALDS